MRRIYHAGKQYCRSLFQEDEQRAKRDPREGSEAGKLVLLTTPKGGITDLECQAGERFARVVEKWRWSISDSPNPNAPAANLQGGTGKTPQRDPFINSPEEEDRITNARLDMELLRKKVCREGMDKPPLEVLRRGQRVWDLLELVFICNQKVDPASVAFMRKHGLKPLIQHFGLTSERDTG